MQVNKSIHNLFLMIRMQARQACFNRMAILATVVSWGLRMGLTILLYVGIYKALGKTDIKGIDMTVAASSMILYAIFSGFSSRDISRAIDTDFKSGAIEIWLNKPVAYLVMKAGEVLGKNLPSALTLIAVAFLFWTIFGLPHADHIALRILAGLPLLVMGIIVALLLYALIGLTVVWLHDSSATFMIVDKFVMVFGGAYIPIAFFPPVMRSIGEFLPTGAITVVSQMFYPDFFTNYPRFVLCLTGWMIVLGMTVYKVNKNVSIHMTVNGG